jgi:hypothetical protein
MRLSTAMVAITDADYIPLPIKAMVRKGVELTRTMLIRNAKAGHIETRLFRKPGSRKGRRYIVAASLDAFLADNMIECPIEGKKRKQPTAA